MCVRSPVRHVAIAILPELLAQTLDARTPCIFYHRRQDQALFQQLGHFGKLRRCCFVGQKCISEMRMLEVEIA